MRDRLHAIERGAPRPGYNRAVPFTLARTRGLGLAGAVAALLTMASATPGAQPPGGRPSPPNVIYIYADDLGIGELGAYGQTKIRTPNLDRMAREGLRFTQHYSSSPVCAPSRAMLLTGLHAGHSYIRGNYELGGFRDEEEGGQMPLPGGTQTIAHMLRRAGYATAAIGKWGLGMHDTTGAPNQQGFDYFFGYLDQKQAHNYYPTHLWENGRRAALENAYFASHQKLAGPLPDLREYDRYRGREYAPEVMTRKAVEFLRTHRDRPFFLYLPYTIPHAALQAPPEAVQQYVGRFDERPYLGEQGYLPTPYPLATYAAMITTLDGYVGRVFETLQSLGLDERTLVLFSSDNGATFNGGVQRAYFDSTDGLRGGKMELYEGGIRAPLIARWPGRIRAGAVTDHVSAQFDLMATLAEIAGIEAPPNDGVSFAPTLAGRAADQAAHAYLYFEYPERGGQLAIRMGRWKGVKTDLKKNPTARWQLYDLESDVRETTDRSASHPEILTRFDAIVRQEHRHPHIREWEFVDPKFTPER
jgi:arylsulfatase A-like enzyme